MTEEIDKLIKELWDKEVKRTGLPLVYDEKETSEIQTNGGKAIYFHQEMSFDLEGMVKKILFILNQKKMSKKVSKNTQKSGEYI